MPNIARHMNTSTAGVISLTPSVFMVDNLAKVLTKGTLMDVKSDKSNLTHEELVARIAKEQDKEAFKILFFHFAPRLKSYLLNFKLDGQKAEDLAQDVMFILWQKADKFDANKAKLSTWLFRVARNKYIDLVRSQKYPELNVDDHVAKMVAPEETDRPLEEKQTSARILVAMEKLSRDQRKVIELSFFKELSHSQIAEEISLPLGTVKSRIRTAFQTLRKELGDFK